MRALDHDLLSAGEILEDMLGVLRILERKPMLCDWRRMLVTLIEEYTTGAPMTQAHHWRRPNMLSGDALHLVGDRRVVAIDVEAIEDISC
jgi:hypothetical protein